MPIVKRPTTTIDHEPSAETGPVASTIVPVEDNFAAAAGFLTRSSSIWLRHDGARGTGWSCSNAPISEKDLWGALDTRPGFKYLEAGNPSQTYPRPQYQTRSDIPHHNDSALWPIVDGKPQDPIKECISLDFTRLIDGSPCSYDALNPTGRRAVTELICKIAWQRGARSPLAKAVLKLGTQPWQQGARTNYIPVFTIVTWLVPDGRGGMRLETEADKPALSKHLDDHNPW